MLLNKLTFIGRENIREYPFEILVHAIKHDYQDLVNEASLVLILKPIIPIVEKLPLELVIPWVYLSHSFTIYQSFILNHVSFHIGQISRSMAGYI